MYREMVRPRTLSITTSLGQFLSPGPVNHTHHLHPSNMAFETERQVAIAAVRRACFLTSSLFQHLRRNETVIKDDESPVTGEPCTIVMPL